MREIVTDIATVLRWRVGAFFGLSVVRAIGESFRLSMILLLLPFLGVDTQTPLDSTVTSVLERLGIPYTLTSVSIGILAAFLLQSILNVLFGWYSAGYANYFAFVWRMRLAEAYTLAKWRFFTELPGGKVQNALSQECNRLRNILRHLFEGASGFVVVLAYLAAAFATNFFATAVLLAFSSVVLLITKAFAGPIIYRSRKLSRQNHTILRIASEQLGHIKIIKAMARGHGLLAALRDPFRQLMINQRFVALLTTSYRQTVELIFGLALILATITILHVAPDIRNAGLVPVLVIFVRALTQANSALMSLQQVNALRGSYEFVRDTWHQAAAMPETADEGTLRFAGDQFRDCISLQDVSVAYPRGVALENLNMELPSGNMTAVVGPSGSGKTTFVDTLLRLHAPSQGQIAVDGRPLDAFTLTSWRRNIGYVSQDSALLDATIADNIRLGVPDAPIDDVEAAAKLAGADAFIREMPDGYETVVGDRGLRLSGGQRQRIALASALLPDPAILILDEATSALDSPTEAAVMEAVDAMRGDRTIVIVAHRLSTVKKADKIYVLQKGRVAEAGTWDELVDADGLFAEMWKYQQKSPEP